MLWLMNSRRVLADSDAVLDHDRAAEEVARADAYIQLNAARKPGVVSSTRCPSWYTPNRIANGLRRRSM